MSPSREDPAAAVRALRADLDAATEEIERLRENLERVEKLLAWWRKELPSDPDYHRGFYAGRLACADELETALGVKP